MNDLTTVMRDHARAGLQTQLDAAVTEGDMEKVRKITADIVKLEVQAAPKAPPYGDVEIRAQLDKQAWFGTDPKKSAKAIELGKTLDPKKFATAEAFAAALVKAVEDEFKPPPKKGEGEETDEETDEAIEQENEAREAAEAGKPAKPRKTDGPKDADSAGRARPRASSGPWTKVSDAPKEVQAEIKRAADKFLPATASKERRDSFTKLALTSHYAAHQRNAGKK
jgi:hypothetical protein